MQAIPAFFLFDRNWRALGAAEASDDGGSEHRPDDALVDAARRLARIRRDGGAMIARLRDRRIVRLIALDGPTAVRGACYALFVERPVAA